MWRIWAYALGRKEGRNQKDADRIAVIRTLIMVQLIITNFFIIAGNVKTLFFITPGVTVQEVNTKS
tara:strand:+ start:516 stop:713 length:198 start_codon:yes stop_codon:yes gene_type:complete